MKSIRLILFGILLINLGFVEIMVFQGSLWIVIGFSLIIIGTVIAIKNIFNPTDA